MPNYDVIDPPYSPALILDAAHLLVESGRPLLEALSTHAMLIGLRERLYSPRATPVPAKAVLHLGHAQILVWN